MATNTETKQNLTFRRYEDGDRSSTEMEQYDWDEYIWQSSWSHKCPTYVHQTPPCQGSCPAGEDIRGWLDIVRGLDTPPEGVEMEEYAFRRSTDANPFPSVMGRVCPAPCEDGCNRNEVEDNVGINSVEQFIGDSALEKGYSFVAATNSTGKKIAIVGAGPAGLAAAYQLRRRGHECVVFDDHAELGGMMKYGIPGYRTPRNILDGEIKRILDMGVEVKLNTKVGVDVSVESLEKDYDAILWAIGAQSGRLLPIPGGEAENCVSGVAFLRAFNEGRLQHITGKIVVVGGGDTSIDVASVARRIGNISSAADKDRPESIIFNHTAHDIASTAAREGAEVVLISRHAIADMPAAEHEITDATREGVEILDCLNPVEVILDENGRAKALKVEKLSYENGKAESTGETFEIDCTLIASAIGQHGDFEGFEDLNNGRGFMEPTGSYEVKGKPGHFVAGDIIRPHLLTTAIGHASVAVEGIDAYLSGKQPSRRPKVDVHHFDLLEELKENGKLPEEKHFGPLIEDGERGTSESNYAVHNYEDRSFAEIIPHNELFLGYFDYSPRIAREFRDVNSANVLQNFEERLMPLTQEQAVDEAKRCMSCGMCFECDNCVIYCPQDAVRKANKAEYSLGRYVVTEYDKCIGCHICAEVCPTGYIQMGMGE
jgi:glutamate synthase (NADPH) small chain